MGQRVSLQRQWICVINPRIRGVHHRLPILQVGLHVGGSIPKTHSPARGTKELARTLENCKQLNKPFIPNRGHALRHFNISRHESRNVRSHLQGASVYSYNSGQLGPHAAIKGKVSALH